MQLIDVSRGVKTAAKGGARRCQLVGDRLVMADVHYTYPSTTPIQEIDNLERSSI